MDSSPIPRTESDLAPSAAATEHTGPGSDCGNGSRLREGHAATPPSEADLFEPSLEPPRCRTRDLVRVALYRDWLCFAGAPSRHVRLIRRRGVRQALCEWPGLEIERLPGTSPAHCLAQFRMLHSVRAAEFETGVVSLCATVNI